MILKTENVYGDREDIKMINIATSKRLKKAYCLLDGGMKVGYSDITTEERYTVQPQILDSRLATRRYAISMCSILSLYVLFS